MMPMSPPPAPKPAMRPPAMAAAGPGGPASPMSPPGQDQQVNPAEVKKVLTAALSQVKRVADQAGLDFMGLVKEVSGRSSGAEVPPPPMPGADSAPRSAPMRAGGEPTPPMLAG